MNRNLFPVAKSVLLVTALASALWVSAGSLTPPPGLIAPTMKDLNDVEPRTAVRNDFETITPIVISSPGSYYLAEDILAIHSQHGIQIDASHVTLDLNGFTIYGNLEVGSLDGIHIVSGRNNITVKNGTIRDFNQNGIYGFGSDGCVIDNVRVINNSMRGILLKGYARITDCMAIDNRADGIAVIRNAVITGCVAGNNGTAGLDGGIVVGQEGGLIFASAANANASRGFIMGPGGMVSASVAQGNGDWGVLGLANGFVHGSAVSGNGNPVNALDIDCMVLP